MRTPIDRPITQNLATILAVCLVAVLAAPGTSHADVDIDLGRGPVTVHVPPTYDPAVPAPLLLFLHGYGPGVDGEGHMNLSGIPPWADELGLLYVAPDGTEDPDGILMWNATDACCDFFGSGVDDSGYLRALIEAIITGLNVDTDRIIVVGASAGGFMAHRMACDHADLIAAIASIAGATWADATMCAPSEPIRVLQIHGSEDVNVGFDGGELDSVAYPGAVETTEMWAELNGCSLEPYLGWPALNMADDLPGYETTVAKYEDGCDAGGTAELWTMVGADHGPDQSADAVPFTLAFLLDGVQDSSLLLYRSFIPAAAYASGAEGAFFQTDIDAINAGATAERFRLLWLPRGVPNDEPTASAEITLEPGAGVRYVNVLHDVFGLEPGAVGAIAVEASSPNLLFESRTYNGDPDGAGGTFGQSMPAVAGRDLLFGLQRHVVSFGTENSGYRTNIGCLNARQGMALIDLELLDQDGNSLATTSMLLHPWANDQINRAFADFRPVRGSVVVSSRLTGAEFFCYGSVVDNTTNDPTTILPQRGGY